ncbi:MAG: hypothetical protein BWY31_00792 [Lentisphaerae bacterium ADurb.Bin242]|nr:MAG: hypothetical protein BWY31_00792 [Lentisphaerae bacterium ADurb.Bin242]
MWKKSLFTLGLAAVLPLCGQNLIVNGDFSGSPANLAPECRSNGGTIALFTEDLTWNKCGQLKVDQIRKNKEGRETVGCAVWIGGGKNNQSNSEAGGFECKPNTVYQFSLDIRGTAPNAGVSAVEWKSGATLWNFKSVKTSVGNIAVQKTWTHYKGTFKTGPDAVRAALYLNLWWDTKHGPMKFKVGNDLLFDNVVITEQKANPLTSPASAPAETGAALKTTKTVSSVNGTFSDFVTFKDNGKPAAETAVEVSSDKTGIRLKIDCREPLKVTRASNGLWSGDVVEIFFGPKAGDRRLSQFVVGPDGSKFSGRGDGTDVKAEWEAKTTVSEGGWHADVLIPFSSLGWKPPENGEVIAFNVARQRKAANELQTWSEVKSSFHDVEHFGRLLIGPYPGGVARAQYEKSQAEKEAALLKEKFEKNSRKTFLAAPVRITEDFSIPFLPDAVFNAPEKIELTAAVNEIKPLALAIANLTDKTVDYRILAELRPEKSTWHDGKPFPGATLRQGVRMRDSGKADGALFDPLPRLNEASAMPVPPKEAGLLWIDFDTAGMKPGQYEGRIRIIPLNGKAIFTKAGYGYGNLSYSGEMTDLPFTLHVRDIELSKEPSIPGNFFSPPSNPEVLKLLTEAGMRIFLINPWSLGFPLDKDGNFRLEAPAQKNLEMLSGLSGKKFFIGFSCYHVFLQLNKNKAELWLKWMQAVSQFMKKNGADPKNCYAEIYDEPDPKNFDEILRVMAAARKAVPEMKLTITLGAHIMSAEQMEKLHPYVDCWILWSHGYFTRPEHLAFIRRAQKEGREIGHYTCDTSLRSSPDRNYRRNAWFGEYHKLDNNSLYVGITGLRECIWKKTPEGEILYHGLTSAVPSVRSMAVRQGMTDVKYLAKLREVGKDSPEAQEFLKNAAKRVVVDFAHDPETPDKVREEAAALILKLQQGAK